ncbi:MAG: omega-6 fatty acid desaturase (delta-12 desaturase) [Verrucomicrobiales bacterium]|jgi:omega-6 fatty acid desaturase (delta-12 desaturase)
MSQPIIEEASTRTKNHAWKALVAEYQQPSTWRACFQLLNTVGAYIGVWIAMYFTLGISWWLTMSLSVLGGMFLIRIFIFHHDCGHGSFFKSRKANDFWGWVCGTLSFTPYGRWRREHALHHASSGHLDRRGMGDIWTLTVKEYLGCSPVKRLAYRVSRHAFFLFVIGPIWLFIYRERIPQKNPKPGETRDVMVLNLVLIAMSVVLIYLFGFWPWLAIQLTTLTVAGGAGIWLFYVQHQYEDAYWVSGDDWDYFDAAIKGSSFYKLPKVLQWFTGNIGFHHIHHLSPRIPNYNLERCHKAHPMFNEVKPLTLMSSLKTAALALWDEKTNKLVSFGSHKRQMAAEKRVA